MNSLGDTGRAKKCFCTSLKKHALICARTKTCITYIVFILERQSFKHIINQLRHLLAQRVTVSLITHICFILQQQKIRLVQNAVT